MTFLERARVPLLLAAALVVVGALVGAGLERCAPPAVETSTSSRELELERQRFARVLGSLESQRTTTTTRTDTRPDGRRIVTVVRTDATSSSRTSSEAGELERARELVLERRTVERSRPWRLELAAAWRVDRLELRPASLELRLARDVLGPLSLGAFARLELERLAHLELADLRRSGVVGVSLAWRF